MAVDILLPQLGLTMTEGLITEWKKKEGDAVKKGEVLFLVENDKATVEVEAQADGVLARILVEPMKTVPVSTVVGVITAAGERITDSPKAEEKAAEAPPAPKEATAAPSAARAESRPVRREKGADGFIPASPLARKAAKDSGIDLAGIRGTGPEGAVVERDLPPAVRAEAAASAAEAPFLTAAAPAKPRTAVTPGPAAVPDYEDVALTRIGVVSAERLTRSWTTIPQFSLYIEARASAVLALRDHYKKAGAPVSVTVILAKVLARSLVKYPKLNAEWLEGGKVRTYRKVNVAVAMDTAEGLVVPVLRDCAAKGYRRLGEEMKALAEKGRNKALPPDDYAGGTVTLSNLGMFGVTRFRAIVNPPQTAIVSVGGVSRKPFETEEGLAFDDFLEIGLTADHRAADGAYAARFLADFKAAVENPALVGD